MDLGIEVILEIFSSQGLREHFAQIRSNRILLSANAQRMLDMESEYISHIEPVITFLQGKNQSMARLFCTEGHLPQASKFDELSDLEWAFGNMGIQDKAKHLCTMFLEDLSDLIIESLDPHFGFSRYAERLGMSANSFDELHNELEAEPSYIDSLAWSILRKTISEQEPKLICFSVPFPGNLYSAFRSAKNIKREFPEIKIAMGGGFPNTELREIKEKRVFDYMDFICLDDGELPIELLYEYVCTKSIGKKDLKRTFILDEGEVRYQNSSDRSDYKQKDIGCPDYSDLDLTRYISVIEVANPMHSLWSDGRWLKLTMAHGCYWGKCTFCDISLDYIKLYEPIAASILVDRMKTMITQTGERGFHFVDEAAPPALMRALALEIIARGLQVSWWTNIRFEKSFSRDLCRLLKASGCIAVSGGLEVASDRLLALIDKGVTVEQVAQVTRNLSEAGILVHTYLMYGYPTQTVQETVDSLEMVRQLFEQDVVRSGFWHQFALTAHSPIGERPADFGVHPIQKEILFAHNDISFKDETGIDHSIFSHGLKKSLLNYMHGIGFEYPLQFWFENEIPKTKVKKDLIASYLDKEEELEASNLKLVWIGSQINISSASKSSMVKLSFHDRISSYSTALEESKGTWLMDMIQQIGSAKGKTISLSKFRQDYEMHFKDFKGFWKSEAIMSLRDGGLLML